ncbi:MAG: hypothetical protein GY712_09525 [Oceanicoccus sp.]|uniref:hypothetical protein n=1 Tax=Oceanicoccus sp. TaxID=2691044 RepID=UPI00260BC72E|nr:hypothetical protein [Oceanicoccus sp.]MCP3908242.1 hypothetical protein [Oceanicoccus sp.]
MTIEIGTTNECINTQYAPLAVLLAHYKQNQVLEPLSQVSIGMKSCDFKPQDKLAQVLVSILAGCPTLSEVNPKLKSEITLAQSCGWPRIADQSGLSRTLDALTLMNIEQLRRAVSQIWYPHSQTLRHDWRGYLWLDFDLSGLPCSKRAQASQKGYFSGKKTQLDGNWPVSVPLNTERRFGLSCIRAINIRFTVLNQPS